MSACLHNEYICIKLIVIIGYQTQSFSTDNLFTTGTCTFIYGRIMINNYENVLELIKLTHFFKYQSVIS